MSKITFNDFQRIMAYDVRKDERRIEVEFYVDDCTEYNDANLGKCVNKDTNGVSYWFGLTEDGLQAYDFNSFEEFVSAKVFKGKSLKDIWNSVSLHTLDACDVEEILPFYFDEKN